MKTCKIEAEIIEKYGDGKRYVVEIEGTYQGRLAEDESKISVIVNQSAVTDIRKEVDWSKVKIGDSVIDVKTTESWFFVKRDGCRIEVARSHKDAIGGVSRMAIHITNAMLLTEWLEKHKEGKDD